MTSLNKLIHRIYYTRFIRYLFVGFSTFALDLGLLYILHGRFKLALPIAVSIAYLFSVFYNFTLSLRWTFTNKEKKSLYLHLTQYLILLGFNYLFTLFFVSIVGQHINYAIAKTIAAAFQVLWTYPIYRYIIFKPPIPKNSLKKDQKPYDIEEKLISIAINLYKSIWFFPVICIVMLCILTGLKISGSSTGNYYKVLNGGNAHDSHLIAGEPRSIRSDEWEWESNMLLAQSATNYPSTNSNIGDKQDMQIIVDVPYKSWSVVFKPQNLSFFILPFSYAFAFKWWLLSCLLVISTYFFILILLPKKRLIAATLATCLLLSPFIQWWYQTITIVPIIFSFMIAISLINLWKAKQKHKIWWTVLLTYSLASFTVVLYPPFQIPCLIAISVFLLGYFIDKKYLTKNLILANFKYIIVAIVIFGAITLGFVANNKIAIHATQNSIYPGKRISTSGYFDSRIFLGNFLESQLQLTRHAKYYVANQSEASNFLLLAPFLTLPAVWYIFQTKRYSKKIDWALLLVTIMFLLFMVRLFIPGTDSLFKAFFLDSVPNNRLIIGIGLIGFIQIILIIRHLLNNKVKNIRLIAILGSLTALICNLYIGFSTRHYYPGYVHNIGLIVVLALFPVVIIYLLLNKKFVLSALVFLVFSAGSASLVNPIYRTPGPLYNSNIVNSVHQIYLKDKSAKWAVVDDLIFENLPASAGAPSITGTYAYPQLGLWGKTNLTKSQNITFNRFAHTIVHFSNNEVSLILKQPDFFEIYGSPCSEFFKKENVKYFIAEKQYSQTYSCLTLKKTISYPNLKFYILEKN